MDTALNIFGIVFIFGLITVANLQIKRNNLEPLVKLGLLGLSGLIITLGGFVFLALLSPTSDSATLDSSMALIFSAFSGLLGIFCFALIFSQALRLRLEYLLMEGKVRRYNADSMVHTTAVILAIFMIVNTMGNFVLAGGVEGLAESLQETGFGWQDLLLNFALYLIAALLGIGFLVRRNVVQSLARLGFLIPKKDKILQWLRENAYHFLIGAFVGFGLFWIQTGMSAVWQFFVSPEVLAEQTAATQEIFAAFSASIWLGLLLAVTAGIGEELLFRGALQPIFGNFLVSAFFVLLHSQYILTPAALIILFVSLIFGLLRQHYSLSSAMAAHFVYNFTPFVLIYLLGQAGFSF